MHLSLTLRIQVYHDDPPPFSWLYLNTLRKAWSSTDYRDDRRIIFKTVAVPHDCLRANRHLSLEERFSLSFGDDLPDGSTYWAE